MAGILAVGNLEVETDIGQCQIQLCVGDITALPKQDQVDVLVISAFPGDYSPTPSSLIGQLQRQLGVNVRQLANDKEEDLRSLYSCWWSKPLPKHLSFKKILCFEGSFKRGKKTGEVVGDIFRCLVSILANKEGTVIMPILATGDQRYSKTKMLKLLVNAAVHWMKAGLPLRCLKIVLFSRDVTKISKADEPLMELFKGLKQAHEKEVQEKESDVSTCVFDVYLSYSENDTKCINDIVNSLKKNKSNLRIFSSIQELDMEKSWQENLYDTITNCQRVMALITPSYLQSSRCTEQYNIALCHSRRIHQSMLVPLYVADVPYMPTYMKLTQYIDCRMDYTEKLNIACITVVNALTVTPLQTKNDDIKVKQLSSPPLNYDIFLSYSHCNEEIAKQILRELQDHHPDINVFIDTAELKAGGAWQQTLYHALDSSKLVIALISNDYLCSKVCLEELSLSVALHQQGQRKIVPLVIEPLQENLQWLSFLSPRNCFKNTANEEGQSITGACEEIIRQLKEPSNPPRIAKNTTSLTCLLEEARSLLFQREYRFESLLVSSNADGVGHAVATPAINTKQENTPSNVDIYIISCSADADDCQLLRGLIHAHNPSLVIKTTSDGNISDRLRFLDDALLIIPLLSNSFTESSELIHELNIAWCRQRSSPDLCFMAITIDQLPDKPTYLHLFPSFFNCEDQKWLEKAALELTPARELTQIYSTSRSPLKVLLCFVAATKYIHQWLQGEDCFFIGLHNKFSNSLLLHVCIQRLKEMSITNKEGSNEQKVGSENKDEHLQTTSNSDLVTKGVSVTVVSTSVVPKQQDEETTFQASSKINEGTNEQLQATSNSELVTKNLHEVSSSVVPKQQNEETSSHANSGENDSPVKSGESRRTSSSTCRLV